MATTPSIISNAEAQLQSEVAALAHRHVAVTWGLLGILGAVLTLGGIGAWVAVKFADAQLARAEAREAKFDDTMKAFQDRLTASEAQRTAIEGQQKVTVQIVHDRDTQTNTAIAAALVPNASAQAVATGLAKAENDVPGFGDVRVTPESTLVLEPFQGQLLTAQKIDRDRLFANLGDETKLYTLESAKSTSLSTDLTGCKAELKEGQGVIAVYKKAAKASRFKKAWHGALTVGGLLAAAYIGHKF